MRTTVEIRDDQHEALLALAGRRGERGFSRLLQDALDSYLGREEEAIRRKRVEDAIAAFDSFTREEGESLHRHVEELRQRWR